MRYKLISCEVFYREMCTAIARSPHQIDVQFLAKGLHDIGSKDMLVRVQTALNAVEKDRYDAVLFGYGLCNNGLAGLKANTVPIVVPCAHDCITLYMGSKERYLDYFNKNPGVYFKTSGWIERGENSQELKQLSIQRRNGMDFTREELVKKYGEENADFLYQQLYETTRNYGQFTFIEMGVEPDARFENQTREEAERRGWAFQKIKGDLSMIQRLVNGEWDPKEFLVVPPGSQVAASYGESVIKADRTEKTCTVCPTCIDCTAHSNHGK